MELKLWPAAAFHLFKSANIQNAFINSRKILILLLLFLKKVVAPPSFMSMLYVVFIRFLKSFHPLILFIGFESLDTRQSCELNLFFEEKL